MKQVHMFAVVCTEGHNSWGPFSSAEVAERFAEEKNMAVRQEEAKGGKQIVCRYAAIPMTVEMLEPGETGVAPYSEKNGKPPGRMN
jgi:hypothetical protein